jgi:hypothetical protein
MDAADSSPRLAFPFSTYSGSVPAGFQFALGWHPDVHAKTRRAIELEALIEAFSKEISEILYVRPSSAPRSRERYSAALFRLIQFMQAAGFSQGVTGELIEFVAALDELDTGMVRHFLKPSQVWQRAVDPSDVWAARAMVAIAVDLAMEAGDKRKSVAREIARQHPLLGPLLQGRAKSFAGAIESWHRCFVAGRVNSDLATRLFAERNRFASEILGKPVQEASVSERGEVWRQALHCAVLGACRSATPELVAEFQRMTKRGLRPRSSPR